jgi:predicted component of type VI protein secretion system
MEVKLVVAKGKSAGRVVPVTSSKFFIGRAPACHLRPGSNRISRHHCAILVKGGVVAVRDFGSTNGTHVNGERVRGQQELKDGDHLTLGPIAFEVRVVTDAEVEQQRPQRKPVQAAATRTSGSSVDDDLDLSEWLGTVPAPTAVGPDAEAEGPGGAESAAAGEAAEEAAGQPQDQPGSDVSEEKKLEMRKQLDIVGVSKQAQAKRVAETPQNAAADALRKFFS